MISAITATVFLLQPFLLAAATMTDYCVVPPYVTTDIPPNVLVMMDNSYCMGGDAYGTYTGSSCSVYAQTTFNPAKKYTAGYFRPDLWYRYDGSNFVPDSSGGYSGNLLNWAVTSRIDLLESILVGGKSVSRQTNVNTLRGQASQNWEKTYNNCKFRITGSNSGGNYGASTLTISDVTASSCTLIPDGNQSFAPVITSMNEDGTRFAGKGSEKETEKTPLQLSMETGVNGNGVFHGLFSLLGKAMDSFASDAEAAALKVSTCNQPQCPLTAGYVGSCYNSTDLQASGGTAPYVWGPLVGSSSGSCPSGSINGIPPSTTGFLSLMPSTGVISGTPTTAGTYCMQVTVTDHNGGTANKIVSISVGAAGNPAIQTGSLTNPTCLQAYGPIKLRAAGGALACGSGHDYTWSLASGSLPSGLALCTNLSGCNYCSITSSTTCNVNGDCPAGETCAHADNGSIYGTPDVTTCSNPYSFTIRVADEQGHTATQAYSVTVGASTTVRSKDYNIRVCVGDYTRNCNGSMNCTTNADCPSPLSCISAQCMKNGIVDMFWGQGRFGLANFTQSGSRVSTSIGGSSCIPANPESSFLDGVENVGLVGDASVISPVVQGVYDDIHYYACNDVTSCSGSTCNPFSNVQQCVKNFVLLISSGEGANTCVNAGVPAVCPGDGSGVYSDATNCGASSYLSLAKDTCFGNSNDLRDSPNFGVDNLAGKQSVSTWIVNPMGNSTCTGAPACTIDSVSYPANSCNCVLSQAAGAGGGNYYGVVDPTLLRDQLIKAFQDIIARAASGTAASVLASGQGQGANLVQAIYYPRRKIFNPSSLSYQTVDWVGRLQNLWYYVDPFFTYSGMREDTTVESPYSKLNLHDDYIVQTYFDTTRQQTMAKRSQDVNGDGGSVQTAITPDIAFESLRSLWEAGLLLWQKTPSSRTVYYTTDGSTRSTFTTSDAATLQSYLQAASSDEAQAIIRWTRGEDTQTGGNFASNPLAGFVPDYRQRTVSIDIDNSGAIDAGETNVWKLSDVLDSTPKISSWLALNSYDLRYSDSTYSTFRCSQCQPSCPTGVTCSSGYNNRGIVFTGANDGMLHAFKLGKLELPSSPASCTFGTNDKACLSNPTGFLGGSTVPNGTEMWAFIPKNALPYLKYMADPTYGGKNHIYTIDLSPYVFDASIGAPGSGDISAGTRASDSWRTILIGGMRTGGASKDTTYAGSEGVKVPVSGVGYSSYFAMDVTDQNNPQLLWEFSDPNLGFSTSGPAIVRIAGATTTNPPDTTNGKWFAVFGSGPTGPIDTSTQQFLAHSDQPLKFFVVDLKSGPGTNNANVTTITPSPSIDNAFAGSMFNSTHDAKLDYQDQAVYVGYVKKCATTSATCTANTWTDGGIGRLLTKEDTNPAHWVWSKVMDGVGPVTGSTVRLQDNTNHILWLYFGTGRYFYERSTCSVTISQLCSADSDCPGSEKCVLGNVDDAPSNRSLFGIKEPCLITSSSSAKTGVTIDDACTTTVSLSDLTNVTSISNVPTPANANLDTFKGWYINLDKQSCCSNCSPTITTSSTGGCSTGFTYCEGGTGNCPTTGASTDCSGSCVLRNYYSERVVTDPLATTSGIVFMPTYKPYNDPCSLGGKSFMWVLNYSNGGAVPPNFLQGIVLMQVSTGSIEQKNISTSLNVNDSTGGRRSSAMEGVPPVPGAPATAFTLQSPVKRVIHMRER